MRWLAAAAIACAAAAPAGADPALVLDRCATLDPAALRTAIQRELAASRPDPHRDELILAVQCPDTVTARLSIELPPPALPLSKTVDLGEVPSELRVKLLAIAAVELLDGAIALRAPPPRVEPPEHAASAPAALPGQRRPGASPPRSPEARTEPSPPPSLSLTDPRPRPRPDAPATRATSGASAIAPRVGVRLYPRTPVPLAHLALEYEHRWFAAGATLSRGSTDVLLGSVSALLATASASTRPMCAGTATRACLRARGELGIARVQGRGVTPMVISRDVRAPYTQLGLSLDVERVLGSFGALLSVEGAWAEGVTATSQDQVALQLDGAVVTVLAGLRWRP